MFCVDKIDVVVKLPLIVNAPFPGFSATIANTSANTAKLSANTAKISANTAKLSANIAATSHNSLPAKCDDYEYSDQIWFHFL